MCLGVELAWIQRGVLALAVWLSYCGDRLLDARRLDGPVGSQRHEFARRHSVPLRKVWLGAAVGMVVLGLSLPWKEIAWGMVMLMGVGGYFMLQHWERTRGVVGAFKELMAGAVFAVGAVFFVMVQASFSWAFVMGVCAWVGLCAMNCMVIAYGDREVDADMRQPSLVRYWAKAREWMWPWAMGVMGSAMGAWGLDERLAPLAGSILVGALALGELARSGAGDGRRVLADTVLLAPILFWL